MKKQLNEEFLRMQKLAGLITENNIPKGWKRMKIDQDQDPEEDIEVESYGAPMEGWDKNHLDMVNIMKTPENKYYITTYIAFGDFEESEQFDTLDDARKEAVRIMNDIKSDWE